MTEPLEVVSREEDDRRTNEKARVNAEPLCPICGVDVPHTHGSKKDWLARRRAEDKARAEEKARMTAEPLTPEWAALSDDLRDWFQTMRKEPLDDLLARHRALIDAARTADPGGLREATTIALGVAFNVVPDGASLDLFLAELEAQRERLTPEATAPDTLGDFINSWVPIHLSYCAMQDDDEDCVCGVGPEYARMLAALTPEATEP